MSKDDYDLVVIGGGAGGIGATRAGARRKARTLLVQHGPIGGDCTFTGCVPSKALIEAAARGASFPEAMRAAHGAIERIAAGEHDDIFRREGIDVIHGWATLRARGSVDIDGHHVKTKRVILATGARPAVPPIPGLDELDFLTNESVFNLDQQPESIAVLGGGAIGCELAQVLARLGIWVTVIEALDRLLPQEEPETSRVLHDVFRADDIDVRVNTRVTRVEPIEPKGSARLHLAHGPPVTVGRVLVAVGRNPVTEGVGLDAAGIETDSRGFIRTDDRLATSAPGIYAVGDVAGKVQFTHAADEMGRIAAANALVPWRHRRFRSERIPAVTFTTPEVARVGLTEREGAQQAASVSVVPLDAVDRAVIAGETQGFVKLIARPRPLVRNLAGGRTIGATVVAPRAGEIIHEAALAITAAMFPARLALTVHAYPTWSVALQQAAAQFFVAVDGRRARPARRT